MTPTARRPRPRLEFDLLSSSPAPMASPAAIQSKEKATSSNAESPSLFPARTDTPNPIGERATRTATAKTPRMIHESFI